MELEYIESGLSVLAGSFYISLQAKDHARLEMISITDALTGMYNRGYFDEIFPKLLSDKKRFDALICFAILDIDFCFRVGGEEFAIIFSAENKDKAFKFMNKIRKNVENLKIKDHESQLINNITISIGLSCKRAIDIESTHSLYVETDKLLYKAKNTGRNRVEMNEW